MSRGPGLIWTDKFKSVTLTPKTNSQTCWLKEISHVMSGTIFFICFLSAISAPLAAPRIFSLATCSTMAKRIQDQKEEERVVSKSRPAVVNLSSFIAATSSAASSPIASESLGMPTASGNPTAEYWTKLMGRSVDVSKAIQGCILRRVDGKAAGRPVASRRRRRRRFRQSCSWNLVLQRGTWCPKQ